MKWNQLCCSHWRKGRKLKTKHFIYFSNLCLFQSSLSFEVIIIKVLKQDSYLNKICLIWSTFLLETNLLKNRSVCKQNLRSVGHLLYYFEEIVRILISSPQKRKPTKILRISFFISNMYVVSKSAFTDLSGTRFLSTVQVKDGLISGRNLLSQFLIAL